MFSLKYLLSKTNHIYLNFDITLYVFECLSTEKEVNLVLVSCLRGGLCEPHLYRSVVSALLMRAQNAQLVSVYQYCRKVLEVSDITVSMDIEIYGNTSINNLLLTPNIFILSVFLSLC